MAAIKFIIPGEAIAQGRPRAYRAGNMIRMYQPEKSTNYQNLVKMLAAEQMEGRAPFIGQISVYIQVYKPIPKSYPKYIQNDIDLYSQPMTKPDLDNVAKAILDGMTGICYKDDAQISTLNIGKQFGEIEETQVRLVYNHTLNEEVTKA